MHAKKVLIPFLLLLALVPLCACTATVPTPGVPLPQLVIGVIITLPTITPMKTASRPAWM